MIDPTIGRPRLAEENSQREKAAECSRLMAKLGLMLDKQRIFDRWVLRLRRTADMHPVWTKRGMNADTLLNEMLRWLRGKLKREETKKQ